MTSTTSDLFNRHYAPGGLDRSLSGRKWHDSELAGAFETGEAVTRKASTGPAKGLKRAFSKYILNAPRIHPKSPDRKKSAERRRTFGGSSCMPDKIRSLYTEGERAALWVIVQEVKRHGRCVKTINAIAAIAGVSRTTVQNAVRKAKHKEQQHISVEFRPGTAGRLSETNVIRIISGFWLRWLAAMGGWFKQFCPSKIKADKQLSTEPFDGMKRAFEMESEATSRSSMTCAKQSASSFIDRYASGLLIHKPEPTQVIGSTAGNQLTATSRQGFKPAIVISR